MVYRVLKLICHEDDSYRYPGEWRTGEEHSPQLPPTLMSFPFSSGWAFIDPPMSLILTRPIPCGQGAYSLAALHTFPISTLSPPFRKLKQLLQIPLCKLRGIFSAQTYIYLPNFLVLMVEIMGLIH